MFKVTAIVPSEPVIDVEKYIKAINAGLDAAASWVQSDFEQTQSSWEQKAEFPITTPFQFARDVQTEDVLYGWVNNGTRPHIIAPHDENKRLFFRYPFAPKTQKNVIGSFNGNRGNKIARPKQVTQSILAREFDETIAREFNETNRLALFIQAEIDSVATTP